MSNALSLFFLGILQGVTEFLPVSSSGHLVLFEHLSNRTPNLAVNIGMHMGSLLAIMWFYRHDWIALLRSLIPQKGSFSPDVADNRRLLGHLFLATLITAPIALALRHPVEGIFAEPAAGRFLALTFSMTAAMLILAHFAPVGSSQFTWRGAIVIGLVQGIAVFPGISRSGSTIAFAQLMGIPRDKAGRFSFLLAIPIIGGAFILEAPHLFDNQWNISHILVGMASAAGTGFFSLMFLEKLLRSQRFVAFAFYLIPLAFLSFFWV